MHSLDIMKHYQWIGDILEKDIKLAGKCEFE